VSKLAWPIAAVFTAVILAAGGVLAARQLRPAVPSASRLRPVVTVTVTAAPNVVTRTRTVHAQQGVLCGVAANGLPYPPGSGTMSCESTCAVTWQVSAPVALGTRPVLTDPAGQSNAWMLTLAGQ